MMNASCPAKVGNFCDYIGMFFSRSVALEHLSKGRNASPFWYTIVGVLISVIGVISTIGNTVVLLSFRKAFKRKQKQLQNVNIISLTISNFGMCFSNLPLLVYSCFNNGWQFGVEACKLDAFLGAFFAFAQIGSLTDIALLRHDVINAYPVYHCSSRRVAFRLVMVWFLAFSLAIMPYLGYGRYMLDGILVSCTFNYIETDVINLTYVIMINCFGIIVPVATLVYSYYGILLTNRESVVVLERVSGSMENRESIRRFQRIKSRENTIFKALIVNITCFIISWFPYAVASLIGIAGQSVPSLLATLAAGLAKASTAMTAILYALTHPNFKGAFCSYFRSTSRYAVGTNSPIDSSNNSSASPNKQ